MNYSSARGKRGRGGGGVIVKKEEPEHTNSKTPQVIFCQRFRLYSLKMYHDNCKGTYLQICPFKRLDYHPGHFYMKGLPPPPPPRHIRSVTYLISLESSHHQG